MTQGDELTHAELRIPITREFARGVYDGETDGELEVPEPDEKLPAVGISLGIRHLRHIDIFRRLQYLRSM